MSTKIESWNLNEDKFITLLGELVALTPFLMNRPPTQIPQEDKAIHEILKILNPYSKENGGLLSINHIHLQPEHFPERGNLIVEYNNAEDGKAEKVISFVGSHVDVVYANKDFWDKDPHKLTVDGDILHGRGTTDCLGHCALLTNLFEQLAINKPKLKTRIVGVFICDEESGGSSEVPVGVDQLQATNNLEMIKGGPVIWLDCADKQPNIGSGGICKWQLLANGKLFHSGFPHKGINSVEFLSDAIKVIQRDFYEKFKRHEKEELYGFECSSSFKPTVFNVPTGSVNQIPGEATAQGDIRLIPFYDIKDAMKVIEESTKKLNTIEQLEQLQKENQSFRGPDSKYVIRDETTGDVIATAKLSLSWLSPPIQGLACHLDTIGYKALCQATKEIVGEVKPLADTGSLPLVADLQKAGLDVQTIGYGVEDAYHADNEFARLSDFKQGFKVLSRVIQIIEES